MKSILFAAVLFVALVAGQSADSELPEYQILPTYIINLSQDPHQRFAQVTLDLKDQINKMVDDYMHLAPRFIRNFFKSNMDVIKLRHLDNYREIEGISAILERETWEIFMLNYAFEIYKALCTSIVARQPDGKVIHGRNMDFAFPDAMRNASYIAKFYRGDQYLYDAVMFGGYLGVASAYKQNAYSFTMNARNTPSTIANYFKTMAMVYIGLPEIGIAIREAFEEANDFDTAVELISTMRTIVPFYGIMSGPGANEGVVITRDPDGVAATAWLDEDNWYIVQTNDDHFAGVCQERCMDAHEHMRNIGEENISVDRLLKDVILQSHNFNYYTIYTTMYNVAEDYSEAYGFDTDMPYVRSKPSDMNFDW
eukprot:CAMPEP_0202959456 /NCGR_PEP_ID=MMETSP1396-20130829/3633_1 /ASSEMBLY_ACC=CAM_ASM_000872 /TAXON_ID= /ORGANISM="Pseudokeronopsis sp., Strain Brazil" /LENGTH=366 /DNA_ID=CAMNT_0049678015 /DNA_START=18 /DNA_END=1115 /DNA_ORIENTATION=+